MSLTFRYVVMMVPQTVLVGPVCDVPSAVKVTVH
jgi:hypothetical protein